MDKELSNEVSNEVSNDVSNNKMKFILYYLITASVISLGGIIYKFSKEHKKEDILSKEKFNELSSNAQMLYNAGYKYPDYFKLSDDKEPIYTNILEGGNNKKSKKKINKKIKKSKKKY